MANPKTINSFQVFFFFFTPFDINSMDLGASERGASPPPPAPAVDEALPYFPGRYVTHKWRSTDVI